MRLTAYRDIRAAWTLLWSARGAYAQAAEEVQARLTGHERLAYAAQTRYTEHVRERAGRPAP